MDLDYKIDWSAFSQENYNDVVENIKSHRNDDCYNFIPILIDGQTSEKFEILLSVPYFADGNWELGMALITNNDRDGISTLECPLVYDEGEVPADFSTFVADCDEAFQESVARTIRQKTLDFEAMLNIAMIDIVKTEDFEESYANELEISGERLHDLLEAEGGGYENLDQALMDGYDYVIYDIVKPLEAAPLQICRADVIEDYAANIAMRMATEMLKQDAIFRGISLPSITSDAKPREVAAAYLELEKKLNNGTPVERHFAFSPDHKEWFNVLNIAVYDMKSVDIQAITYRPPTVEREKGREETSKKSKPAMERD